MGLGIHLYAYFAVETPLTVFFVDTGASQLLCSRDPGHKIGDSAKFCEHCGGATRRTPILIPTPPFKRFCEQQGVDPRQMFEALREEDCEWTSDDGEARHTLGWYCLDVVSDGEPRDSATWGLGIRIRHRRAYNPEMTDPRTWGFTEEDLTPYRTAMAEVCEKFEITRTPKLYFQTHLSC